MTTATGRTLLLGVDVGTSGTKVVLLDADGATVDETTVGYGLRSPQPGWTEQDPEDWWAAFQEGLKTLWARGHAPSDVAAVGLSGQMHSLVVLDAAGAVLCPAILWSDNRTGAECAEITATFGREGLLERTGNLALAGFTAPKILWVRTHWPEAYAKAAHLLLAKDFLRFRLSGALASDMSDASGTLLLDVRARRWADDVIAELGIDRALLPEVVEGSTITGTVSAEAAARTGLMAGTPIVGGGGDNAAAAVGLGAVDPGILTLSIGTSGRDLRAARAVPGHRGRVAARVLPRVARALAPDVRDAGRGRLAALAAGRAVAGAADGGRCRVRLADGAGRGRVRPAPVAWCSCRICRGSGRRSTTRSRAARGSGCTWARRWTTSCARCWRAWRSASGRAWT